MSGLCAARSTSLRLLGVSRDELVDQEVDTGPPAAMRLALLRIDAPDRIKEDSHMSHIEETAPKLASTYVKLLNTHNPDLVDQVVAENYVDHNALIPKLGAAPAESHA
jgi:predicted MPP superfamily phosphohydrolase